MATPPILILNAGGLRSLVATARFAAEHNPRTLALLYLRDGRAGQARRAEHVKKQASHLGITHIYDAGLPQRLSTAAGSDRERMPLIHSQLLLASMAFAVQLNAEKIVWPAQCNGDFTRMARLTEQSVLVRHMAQVDHEHVPSVHTPLLEMTDAQVIELGGQLDAPWHLAWTCQYDGEKACHVCDACRQRYTAFNAAGMLDFDAEPVSRSAV